ncbi:MULTISPECIES: FliM/FliN family flagellar motor switch protein [unclassified Sphingomonas]|uniref:flagellar motor switch protein FliM n=1 Tax=unclassified Sphingomonas TaxID=196159 RepID=UPI000928EDAA|nr:MULTISPECIES: FliM/FliN family flagellar motor switch protein [unclassified Sphingomonas]MBN8847853.1 FliM/FliN family flagellar motor switch protein [Sphingomonas sp.]OJV33472.1 MAG: flagellar motor switch protein FliM [Sphingomonas sp. 67-36]
MVNAASPSDAERRERARTETVQPGGLGQAKLNPFGDLHTLQHLSARLARSLRGVFEPVLRQEVRTWAEPLMVQRFADYRVERPDQLTAWLPLGMDERTALCVLDGRFVLELLDLFFGGIGHVPAELPHEFSPAAEAMVARLGEMIAAPLTAAWEPLARVHFTVGRCEANAAMLTNIEADDAMIVTRFGIARGHAKPVFIDLVYPVTALKPHGTALTGKVVAKSVEQDAQWTAALTRAAMQVRFPVRSVLAEPVISLARLMELKPGDVIPIHFTNDVPVMVGNDRLGTGTVGTANGHAAIRLTKLASLEGTNA